MSGETVTIPVKRYNELLEAEAQLRHLESMGVDNWEGYSYHKDEDDEWDEDEE